MLSSHDSYVGDGDRSVGGLVPVEPGHHPRLERGGGDDEVVILGGADDGAVVLVTTALVLHPRVDHRPVRSVHVVGTHVLSGGGERRGVEEWWGGEGYEDW